MDEPTLFQPLDTKADCMGYFSNNQLHRHRALPREGGTWDYSSHLEGKGYELARIYTGGETLSDVCPPALKEEWEDVKRALKACLKACHTSSLSLSDNCFYDVVPEYFLFQYLSLKNKITEHVLGTRGRLPITKRSIFYLMELSLILLMLGIFPRRVSWRTPFQRIS